MFFKFFKHTLLAYRRAHFFEKNLTVNIIIGFAILFFLIYIMLAGMLLPHLLHDFFPGEKIHELVFKVLIFIMFGDLITRWFMQKIPAQNILPYFHYPISKNSIANFFIIRAWFNIFNIYLLVFFIPFFYYTIAFNVSGEAFLYSIAGIIVLSGLNHSLIIVLKTISIKNNIIRTALMIIALVLAIIGYFHYEQLFNISLLLGNSFMSGSKLTFAIFIISIICLQVLSKYNLKRGFYFLFEDSESKSTLLAGSTFMGGFFSKIPVYGKFWDLEWKLITRNKRSKNNFYQFPIMLPVLLFFFWWYPAETISNMLVFLMLFAGSYGFFHLQFFLSWESRYFDYIASKNINFKDFFKAKYYFYSCIALIQFLILLPFLYYINPFYVLVYFSIMTYTIGAAFCIMLFAGISHSTRINPNQKAFMNFEGISGIQFLMIFVIMCSIIPFLVIGHIINTDYGVYYTLIFTGIIFWITHPYWIKKAVNYFLGKKYIKLQKFREN